MVIVEKISYFGESRNETLASAVLGDISEFSNSVLIY